MAVQKSKVSRSRRNMRRAHDSLKSVTVSTDAETGERHRRHHMTPDGFYKGRQIVRNSDD
jgi:large subunit ribosomal protein L32